MNLGICFLSCLSPSEQSCNPSDLGSACCNLNFPTATSSQALHVADFPHTSSSRQCDEASEEFLTRDFMSEIYWQSYFDMPHVEAIKKEEEKCAFQTPIKFDVFETFCCHLILSCISIQSDAVWWEKLSSRRQDNVRDRALSLSSLINSIEFLIRSGWKRNAKVYGRSWISGEAPKKRRS